MWLHRTLNCDVTINRVDLRQTAAQLDSYTDRGDLIIDRGRGAERIEVKHRRRLHFTCSEYPYPSVIVDVCHTWDRAPVKPSAYLIYSDDMRTLAVVPASSAASWQQEERYDNSKKRLRRFYLCPVSLVRFVSLRGPRGVGPTR